MLAVGVICIFFLTGWTETPTHPKYYRFITIQGIKHCCVVSPAMRIMTTDNATMNCSQKHTEGEKVLYRNNNYLITYQCSTGDDWIPIASNRLSSSSSATTTSSAASATSATSNTTSTSLSVTSSTDSPQTSSTTTYSAANPHPQTGSWHPPSAQR